ncbi:hypothetical protein CEXT_161431 [Caerostris extrusa]|uniref:Maturase K n=1 Tax=Caerostris extrusa TaxID=172846 RepID=A0AAV4WQT4_CAEEX|nr:hypothetical protein CEXT_161431 [Caerostris extrusa]
MHFIPYASNVWGYALQKRSTLNYFDEYRDALCSELFGYRTFSWDFAFSLASFPPIDLTHTHYCEQCLPRSSVGTLYILKVHLGKQLIQNEIHLPHFSLCVSHHFPAVPNRLFWLQQRSVRHYTLLRSRLLSFGKNVLRRCSQGTTADLQQTSGGMPAEHRCSRSSCKPKVVPRATKDNECSGYLNYSHFYGDLLMPVWITSLRI